MKKLNLHEIKNQCFYRFTGITSGFLLMLPQLYPALAPLQAVALIPILCLGLTEKVRPQAMVTAGIYTGLAYTLPQVFILQLPVLMTLILLGHLTIILTAFALVAPRLLRDSPVLGAFVVGAFLVLLDWLNFTIVPIWGTAQSFVRCWSYYPGLISFVSLTGITGIIFVLGTLQALLISLITNSKHRGKILLSAVALVLVCLTANLAIRCQRPTGTLKVAAIGWTWDDSEKSGGLYCTKGFRTLFTEPAAKAASQGTKLIVSPEIAFQFTKGQRRFWLERFGKIARQHNIFLAIGYLDIDSEENRMLFMNPQGEVIAEYTKTYLTAFEDFRKGSGQLVTIDIDGVSVGGMICHDDNFIRFSRQYGRKRVPVVAIPTLDWLTVKNAHLQSSIHRAIESRYTVVRAAMDGISAIISPMGELLVTKDNFTEGPGMIIAEVPLYNSLTLFSIAGHWFVFVCATFLLCCVWRHLPKQFLKKPFKFWEKNQ